jgi:hypothetical protein
MTEFGKGVCRYNIVARGERKSKARELRKLG